VQLWQIFLGAVKPIYWGIPTRSVLFFACYNHGMYLDGLLSSPQIKNFCHKHHIRQLSFFGSVVRDDFGPQSDIDVLVEFEPGHTPGFDFFLMEAELSQTLERKVDLQTLDFLSPEIRGSVLSEAVPAYEQA
jgi:predicted nucleotidyltransferase